MVAALRHFMGFYRDVLTTKFQLSRVNDRFIFIIAMSSEKTNTTGEDCSDFPKLAGQAGEHFFPLYYYWSGEQYRSSKKLFGMLIQHLQSFESFLDDHGARRNKTWYYFSELIASMRNLGIVAYLLHHVFYRYDHYKLSEIEVESADFIQETGHTLEFVNQCISKLFAASIEEANKLSIPINKVIPPKNDYRDIKGTQPLPDNLDFKKVEGDKEKILSLARKVRKVAKMCREDNLGHKHSTEELLDLVPLKLNEKKARKLKNTIHGVQSDYDTYVKNTVLESNNLNLGKLRRATSIPLHLLEAARWLSHFYERHESNIAPNTSAEKILDLVNKNDILDRMINFCFYYSNVFLQKGNSLAEAIMTEYVEKVQYEFPIPTPLGFHAKPSTYVSLIVNEHGTDVEMIVDGKHFNAKSVINLLMAAGLIAEKGYDKVIFEGDKQVLDDLKILADNNYCEDNKIPAELSYLRILRNMPRV